MRSNLRKASPRRALPLLPLVIAFCVLPRAFGQCNLSASATITSTDSATYTLQWSAGGSFGTSGGPVEIFLNGITQQTCPTSPCVGQAGSSAACVPANIVVGAQCRDINGQTVSQSTTVHVEFDHQPSISNDVDNLYGVNGGGYGLFAHFQIHAPASYDRVVTYTWLPDGISAGSHTLSGPGPDYTDLSPAGIPDKQKFLKATIWSCGDKQDTAIVAAKDPACCSATSPAGPGAVGEPITVANGNMRMTDADPLPSSVISLARTYDNVNRDIGGRFGFGWHSFLDRGLTSVSLDGFTYVTIDTADGGSYVFRGSGGAFAQAWPLNGIPATLAYDGASGAYTLHEPLRDVEVTLRASDGVPLKYHSRSSGRDVTISYFGNVPTAVADSYGNWSWTVTADANGRVSAISVDGTTNTWQYTYDGSGRLTTVQGPNGAAWRTYAYGSFGMTSASDAAGRLIESHAYNASAFATRSLSAQGDITDVTYGLTADALEYGTRVTYATGAQAVYYTQAIGGRPRTTRVVGGCSGCGTNDATYAHDKNGNVVREQDARGYIATRSFDNLGRVVSLTVANKPTGCDPETNADHCRLASAALKTAALDATPATATTTYAFGDTNWPDRPTQVITTSVANPQQSRIATYAYDATTGAVLREQIDGWKNATDQESIVSTTALCDGVAAAAFNPGGNFDAAWLTLPQPAGLKRSFDGPRTDAADVTQWVYYPVDSGVPALLRGRLAAVRDAVGSITRFETDDAFGNATRVVDPNGVATESTYDPAGRLLTTTLKGVPGCDSNSDPLCATDIVTQRTYSPTLGPLTSETRPNGGTTTYEYDTRRRMTALTRTVSASVYERAEYDYDTATGKRSAERYKSGTPGAWTLARSEGFAYDTLARMKEIDHPDGTKIVYTYDGAGNLATVQDERHTVANTSYSYDPLNRLTSVQQTLTTAPGGSIVTSYAYDVAGNLTSVVDPNGNATTYTFDDLGRMLTQVSPVTGTTAYAYDPAGDLTSSTDGNGATTTRTYDAAGRVLLAVSSCSGSDTEQVAWTYDDASPGQFGIGRLASMTDPSGSTAYAYERRGLLLSEDRMIGSSSSMMNYAYDITGNRTRLGDLDYAYDLAGRPSSVGRRECTTCAPVPLVTSASYMPFGPEKQIVFGNGTRQDKSYDGRYRVTENKLTGPGSLTAADYSYTSDAGGNILSIHDVVDGTFDRTFGYDDLNRLVSANSGTSLWGNGAYAYDRMGNVLSIMLGQWSESFTFVGTTPLIATVVHAGSSYAIDYDAAGNEVDSQEPPYAGQTSSSTVSVARAYSCRNLTAIISTAGGSGGPGPGRSGPCPPFCSPPPPRWLIQAEYIYDGRGIRVHGDDVNGGTDYFYTPDLQLAQMQSSRGEATEFAWLNGHAIAQIATQSSTYRFTFTDHLGTPLLQTDSTGQIIWSAEYEPYGRIYILRNGTSAKEQPLRFPGQEMASQGAAGAEDHYNIFRWYRGGWGRYTQADPLGLGPDINMYRYANSNPVDIDDPLGLDTAGCDEIGKYQINETPCRLECCAHHDRCYDINHCSSGSWPDRTPKTACDTTSGCRKCNDDVKDCFKKCLRKELFGTKDDPKKPNYYCGAQHRFIRIPGDFRNISDAQKACECDYSKSCGLPSRPSTPTVPKSKP